MKKIAAILLILIAIVMIIVGVKMSILPPILTGVGFILIAWVFLMQK
jgi:hypothetical protein